MTTGPSDAELAKQYWRKQAQHLRAQLEEGNPSLKPTGGTGAKPWKPVEDAAIAGASSRAFLTAFGNGGSEPSVMPKASPSEVATAKGRIIEAMVQAGRDTRYIEDAMQKISPHLDVFALSTDPAVQSVLLQRIMNNGSGTLGMHDLVEAIQLIQNLRNPSQQAPQSDPTTVMNAAGNLFRTGVETARGKNDGIDMAQMLQMQQQSHDRLLQLQEEHFRQMRELQQQPTLVDSLKQVREVQDLIGTAPDKPEIATKKLELAGRREEREFQARSEVAKDRRQSELVKSVTGTLQKALESPVIQQFGKNLGRSMGLSENKVVKAGSEAPAQTAQAQLRNPLQAPYNFICPKCRKETIFSTGELLKVQNGSGRWMCSCGAAYQLKPDDKSADEESLD